MQRWPETKRLLGLLVNSAGAAHARNARRLVRMARKPSALARELLKNFPKGKRRRGGRRRRKKGGPGKDDGDQQDAPGEEQDAPGEPHDEPDEQRDAA